MGNSSGRFVDPTKCTETCTKSYECTSLSTDANGAFTDFSCRLNEKARMGLIAGFSALAFLLFVLAAICFCLKCRRNRKVVPKKKNSPDRCCMNCFNPEYAEPEKKAPSPKTPPRTPIPTPTPEPMDEPTWGIIPGAGVVVASDVSITSISEGELGRVDILNTNVVRPTDFDPKSSSSSSSSSSDSD